MPIGVCKVWQKGQKKCFVICDQGQSGRVAATGLVGLVASLASF